MDPLPLHTIIWLVCWSFWLFPFCASSGSRLLPDKPLSVGSTITSDDGTFALGFFSRAMPITDPSSATLAFTSGSNLALSDTKGTLLWTTNISAA
uniref:non-specific serine/threonine protein kinase n=1 Tax=Aegilops tauschii subsp. strangulata TaxID=200361 RepID=A0A453Q1W6_AEGTS